MHTPGFGNCGVAPSVEFCTHPGAMQPEMARGFGGVTDGSIKQAEGTWEGTNKVGTPLGYPLTYSEN